MIVHWTRVSSSSFANNRISFNDGAQDVGRISNKTLAIQLNGHACDRHRVRALARSTTAPHVSDSTVIQCCNLPEFLRTAPTIGATNTARATRCLNQVALANACRSHLSFFILARWCFGRQKCRLINSYLFFVWDPQRPLADDCCHFLVWPRPRSANGHRALVFTQN